MNNPMTLIEAIAVLINEEHIGDFIYNIRERTDLSEFTGNSWNHPRVKQYSDAVQRLSSELTNPESPERTLASLATMLGWVNVPPRQTLEREINELKRRAINNNNINLEHSHVDTTNPAIAAIITSGRYWAVNYDELTEHCAERAEYHKARELHYRTKADNLDIEAKQQMEDLSGDEALEAKANNSYGKRINEREEARQNSRHHAKMALRFLWLGSHLVADQPIQLTQSDAQALELIL